jgi:hypothetical protein
LTKAEAKAQFEIRQQRRANNHNSQQQNNHNARSNNPLETNYTQLPVGFQQATAANNNNSLHPVQHQGRLSSAQQHPIETM